MAAQKTTPVKVDKDTLGKVWEEVQNLGLKISGLNQNVNAVGSNTNAASAKVAAAATTGQAAGGASAILMIAAVGLVLFWFWKGK